MIDEVTGDFFCKNKLSPLNGAGTTTAAKRYLAEFFHP
jgi:hypothetical protein